MGQTTKSMIRQRKYEEKFQIEFKIDPKTGQQVWVFNYMLKYNITFTFLKAIAGSFMLHINFQCEIPSFLVHILIK